MKTTQEIKYNGLMPNRLILLDIDNTLLNTWQYNVIAVAINKAKGFPMGYPESFDAASYQTELLNSFPNSFIWEQVTVCPRPHLETFLSFLYEQDFDIGIYSTAVESYLKEVLPQLAPDLLSPCKFLWSRSDMSKQKNPKLQYIRLICETFGYELKTTCIIDDLPIVTPWQHRLSIEPFKVTPIHLEKAKSDTHLLAMMDVIKQSLSIKDFSVLRDKEQQALKAWQDKHDAWSWKERLKPEEDQKDNFPEPKPETLAYPFDGQPES